MVPMFRWFRVRLWRLTDLVTAVMAAGATVALIGIVFSYCFEVVARYGLNAPTVWASDTVTYLLSASIFLMVPYVAKQGRHVAITILPDALAPRPRAALLTFADLAGFVASASVAWITLAESLRQFGAGTSTLALMPIPKWWISLPIGLGFALAALQFLRRLDEAASGVER